MFKKVKILLGGKTVKDVIKLTSGTVMAQVLPILFFPVLSRLYTPADYGVLGLFMGITMVVVSIAALQLNMAITIPKEDEEALNIIATALFCVKLVCILSLFLIGGSCLIPALYKWLTSVRLIPWVFIIPVVVFFSASATQFQTWFVRSGNFDFVTKARITTAIVTVGLSLLFTLFWRNEIGLLASYLLGSAIGWVQLQYYFRKQQVVPSISWKQFCIYVSRYKNFVLYSTPTEFVSNFAQQLPLYILSIYGGAQSVGWFTRCRQILGIPISYISASIAEVYRQKASEYYRVNPQGLPALFSKTMKSLAALGFLPFLVLIISGPFLFELAFGNAWRQAGVYSQYLGVMYFLRFVFSPLAFNFYLVGKQSLDLFLQIIFTLISSLGLFAGFYFFDAEVVSILFFSTGFSLMYVVYGYFSKQIISKSI